MRYVLSIVLLVFASPSLSLDHMLADITESIESPFGTYTPIPVIVDPSVEPWEIEPDLSNVINAENFILSDREKELLASNSFVIVPGQGKAEVYDYYNENRDRGIPSFVTSDALLHTYHVLFDHLLKTAELEIFFETLRTMNSALVTAAEATLTQASSPAEISSSTRLLAFHSVAASLLDSTFVLNPDIADVVAAELSLILNHTGQNVSPTFGYSEDYTQYKVRGHYTANDTLGCYFRAMMWYGRMAFILDGGFENQLLIRDLTLTALLLVRDTAIYPVTQDQWTSIYWPTVFFVGRSDDLIPEMYRDLALQVYGQPIEQLSVADLADSTMLELFITQARATFPQPQIGAGAPQGLRFMGQRFIPDSYILDQVVFIHTDRFMPKGLDVMAALGSDRALWILDNIYHEFGDPLYVSQLEAMRDYVSSLSDSTWAENLYYNWLYSLMPLLFDKDQGWPVFMTNPAWSDRELSTSLMSWSELRHDTILYAKQSETEIGIPPGGALVQGYVEPNPYLWARLAALAEYTGVGLQGLDLISPIDYERLQLLRSLCLNLLEISLIELQGGQLSPEQDSFIARVGLDLRMITSVDSEVLSAESPDPADSACTAVVADVHTDPNTNTCLEEGVGYPWNILVVVPRGNTLLITRGVFLPYYEFVLPVDERLTDEEWRELLTGAEPPSPPVWTSTFRDTTSSLQNPSPQPCQFESKGVCVFSYVLTPDPPDTGMTVDIEVRFSTLDGFTIAEPSLTIVTSSGDSIQISLQPLGQERYQGSFNTEGWPPGKAIFWFQAETPAGWMLLDYRALVQVGEGAGTEPPPQPGRFRLYGVQPNPVVAEAIVSFTLPDQGPTRLSLWDFAGREEAVLYDGHLPAGHHVLPWSTEGTRIPRGAYLLRLSWEDETRSQVVVMKK